MSYSQARQQYVKSQGINLAVYQQGDAACPTLVLLHGYPDNAQVWQPIVQRLAQRYHVVTFDLPGCGQSDAPKSKSGYAFETLTTDLIAVLDAACPQKAVHLVGHDWGALLGWDAILSGRLDGKIASWSAAAPPLDHIALWFHERLAKPTPLSLLRAGVRLVKSSYMLAMQLPWLPELTWKLVLNYHWETCVSLLERQQVNLSSFQLADALNGIALYRQNFLSVMLHPQLRTTQVPVQLLKMRNDPFVSVSLFDGVERFASHTTHTVLPAGHWGLLSQPQAIAHAVDQFVSPILEVSDDALSISSGSSK